MRNKEGNSHQEREALTIKREDKKMSNFQCTHSGITVNILNEIMSNDLLHLVLVEINGKKTWFDRSYGAANGNLSETEANAARSAMSEYEEKIFFC